MGVASTWQELLSQVLGSISGNPKPKQSFPFGENSLLPLVPKWCGDGLLVRLRDSLAMHQHHLERGQGEYDQNLVEMCLSSSPFYEGVTKVVLNKLQEATLCIRSEVRVSQVPVLCAEKLLLRTQGHPGNSGLPGPHF